MQIKPSAKIRQNYNEIAELCRSTGEPVYLTKNGEGDLREELLAVEEDRLCGCMGSTLDELSKYLDGIIDEVEDGKDPSV